MDMRGLAHFIQDVRKATSSLTEEKKRVDLELVKIRSKFRNAAAMSTYERKKYVCKLMFIAMLGYPVEFGHMEGVKLLALTSPAEKLIGYLSVTVFLHENHALLKLATHMIYKDLLSEQEFNMNLALTAIANTGGKDFAEVLSSDVKGILLNDRWNVHIRKKAVLTYLRIYRKYPAVVDLAEVVPAVTELLHSPLFGMSGCAALFLTGCLNEDNFHLFRFVPDRVIGLLGKIILAKQTEPGYVYYGVPAPWLQAMAIRLLRKFPVPTDTVLKENILLVLRMIVQATDRVLRDAQAQQKQKGTMNRVSAMNAVFFEVISLVIEWDIDTRLYSDCLDVLSGFVTEKKESNLRYLGFSLLSKLSSSKRSYNEYRTYCSQYQPQVVVALHDPDVSIRTKALDISVNMCDDATATEVIEELLSYLPIADGVFKENLVLAISRLAEVHCVDYGWYVDVILSMLSQAGRLTPQHIICRVVHVIINHPYVQKRAATTLFNLLKGHKTVPEVLLRVAAIVLGEFGYQIALNAESTPLMQVKVLQNYLSDASEETQSIMLSTFVKLYNYYDITVREKILSILYQYRSSFNVELQQRAMEYVGLVELGNDELLQKVLEPLPSFGEDEFSLVLRGRFQREAVLVEAVSSGSRGEPEIAVAPMANEVSNKTAGSNFLVFNHDAALRPGSKADVDLGALFTVTSAAQLEGMTRENELARQRFIFLLQAASGVLYSDEAVELHCEQQYRGADARVTMTVRNKLTVEELENVLVEITGVDVGLLLQSRNDRGDITSGGVLRVEFAARSRAPYGEAPTVRLSYRRAEGHTTQMKVLALPIVTTRFLTPYDEKDEASYETLCKEMNSLSATTRHLSAGCVAQKDFIAEVLTRMGFRVMHAVGGTEWKAMAAHATQSHGVLCYDPVVVNVFAAGAGELAAKVIAKSSVLRAVIVDVLEQSLLGSVRKELDEKTSVSGDTLASLFP
ncbi:alpha-adaptin-like protein [Trypanosoma rangeli]|uniref:AP-2 complex subunit alpha n=1 Tax=Trypanosoma rangeli TaxID=5698 RepID=A0A422NT90_TRYRA|nr:alpha-adaptin-like protein [Trypanosoma rangeli]RNF08697.1 alpha-adaptin-like protein [Trypanosoma rangeli]|eukprot:RNF08697.1 alpha-adaptin-like protein [Trypanosoma rangeli]